VVQMICTANDPGIIGTMSKPLDPASPMRTRWLLVLVGLFSWGCGGAQAGERRIHAQNEPVASAAPPIVAPVATARVTETPTQPERAEATETASRSRHRIGGVHVVLGVPTDADPSDDIVLDETYFVLSYNADRKVPNWVSWRLTRDDLGSFDRSNKFHADTLLPAAVTPVVPTDYGHSGFDQGHMCPSAQRTASEEANFATFVMTNMQPQLHALNAGPWKSLETYERKLANDEGTDVYVLAGGIFGAAPKKIGPGIAVPKANYRITVVLDHGSTKVTTATPVYAVVMPNADAAKGHKWSEFMTSVDKIEQATGYDFLADVPDDVENVVEARVAAAP
jgi:endonuclease G, mitochondrial